MTRSQAHADKKAVIAARVEQEWALKVIEQQAVERESEHLCAKCKTPGFGKSAIPCPNEPRRTR